MKRISTPLDTTRLNTPSLPSSCKLNLVVQTSASSISFLARGSSHQRWQHYNSMTTRTGKRKESKSQGAWGRLKSSPTLEPLKVKSLSCISSPRNIVDFGPILQQWLIARPKLFLKLSKVQALMISCLSTHRDVPWSKKRKLVYLIQDAHVTPVLGQLRIHSLVTTQMQQVDQCNLRL